MPHKAFSRRFLHLHDILNQNELKNKTHLTAKMYEKLLSRHTGLSGIYIMTARLDATAFIKKKVNHFFVNLSMWKVKVSTFWRVVQTRR